LAVIQPQLVEAVAARSNLSVAEVGRALSALEEVLLEEVIGAVTRRLTGLIQIALGPEPPEPARTQATDWPKAIAARSEGT
jgi:hypothetical protein